MTHPIVNLEILNVLTQPTRANIFEIIAEESQVTFKDLMSETHLTRDALAKHLARLQQYSLVKADVAKPEGDKYVFYRLTKQGKEFHTLLHNIISELSDIPPPRLSEKFLLDSDAVKKIIEAHGHDHFTKIFNQCSIVLTSSDFVQLLDYADETNNEKLEEFLNNEKSVEVSKIYKNPERGTSCEFYLRRAKKLPIEEAQRVATAVDFSASIISDNEKVLSSARALGIICTNVDMLLNFNLKESLQDEFYKLAFGMADPPSIDFITQHHYTEILKKNLIKTNNSASEKNDELSIKTIENDYAEGFSTDIITNLNGIKNENYAAKIAYEIFKYFSRPYERKYQKDIKECLMEIEPIFNMLDTIYYKLSTKIGKMNLPIKNSFMLAHGEATYLEKISKIDSNKIDESLSYLTTFDAKEERPFIQRILSSTSKIIEKEWIGTNETSQEILLAMAASKRKLERELDWTFCSFNEDTFSSLQNSKTHLVQICNMITPSIVEDGYNPDNANVVGNMFDRLRNTLKGDEWRHSQHLSFLFKDDHTENIVDVDTKMIPDANDLSKVISIIKDMDANGNTVNDVSKLMNVSERMAQYYLDAAIMLGLCYQDHKLFYISEFGVKLDQYSEEDRKNIIEQSLLQLPIIKAFLLHLNSLNKNRFKTEDIAKFLHESTNLSANTSMRRASTLASWLSNAGIVKRFDKTLILKHDDGQMKLGYFI